MTRRPLLATLLTLTALACSPAPDPLEPASPTLEAFHRGEGLVREGLEAMGGLAALETAGGITLVGEGTFDLSTRMQGTHPDRPEPVALEEAFAVDLDGGRVAYEVHAKVNPDADEWIRYVHDDEGRMLIVLRSDDQAFWVPGDPDHKRRTMRTVPQILLRDALAERHALRYLGRAGEDEAVGFTFPTGEAMTLLFDPETHRLQGFEYLLDLPLLGDTPIRWRFAPYRQVEGLGMYPAGYRILQGERLLKRVEYSSIRPGVEGAAVFDEPKGISFPEPPPPSEPGSAATGAAAGSAEEPDLPEVRTLADGVYLALGVRGGFHVMFVELEDSVLVVDTPAGYHELQMVPAIDWAGDVTSSSVGRRLLHAVRATIPDKPVRYVVLTHHHGDHAGGIRPFLDAGVTVLASEVTRPVVEAAARATFRLEPDELTGRDVTPRIEVVEGEREISDGERSVRILDVGPNPHVEGMLVVYLPEERILYQSDLFMPSGGDFPDPARVPVMRWFVDWLDGSGLEPEAIFAIHGSARVTDEQLEAIRALE